MKKKVYLVVILLVVAISVITGGCEIMEKKPLWKRLEDIQYNSYKPTLDHLEQKYGEGLFEMDVYGQITLKNPPRAVVSVEYNYNLKRYEDNYNILSRKVEFEELIQTTIPSLYLKSKVNLANSTPTINEANAPLEEFLVDLDRPLIRCNIFIPLTDEKACQKFYNELIAEINNRKYVVNLSIWCVDENVYNVIDSDTHAPKKYAYRISADYNSSGMYEAEWKEGEK